MMNANLDRNSEGKKMASVGDQFLPSVDYKWRSLKEFQEEFPDWKYSISLIYEPPLYRFSGHKDGRTYWISFFEDEPEIKAAKLGPYSGS